MATKKKPATKTKTKPTTRTKKKATTKTKQKASRKTALELQIEGLERVANVFQQEAEKLRANGPTAGDASVGPAAEAGVAVEQAGAPPPKSPDTDSDVVSDDVAERLEWVTDEWEGLLADFLDRKIEAGSGAAFFDLYEVHNYNHAAEVLVSSYPDEFAELAQALLAFRIKTQWIITGGGNQSPIPQALQKALYPLGWHETRLKGHMVFESHITEKKQKVKGVTPVTNASGFPSYEEMVRIAPTLRQLVVDAHMIDHVKGRVAFDMEWNSKDQTFDRDLYAMRLFHEAHLIGAGVLLTRSKDLNPVFKDLDPIAPKTDNKKLSQKYGASTTWMGKLLYRLRSSRSGGCPVLALGIKRSCISDWDKFIKGHRQRLAAP